ncbi:hypothetical protein NHF48_020550 [Sphingomonas sp. H160509]|nr:hypothetical protein [Sphingomonas sp. H160509]MDD1452780.1 hypothetical protein [Sphingomonas sp. H160509]
MVERLHFLANAAQLSIAVDLPSGLATDSGEALSAPPVFDLTLALGAVKPAHLLQPAARYCGQIRLLDIGVPTASQAEVLKAPSLPTPGPDSHKYTRGMVAIVAGTMSGASDLAALAAMRAGAGYVTLLGDSRGPRTRSSAHRSPITRCLTIASARLSSAQASAATIPPRPALKRR